MTLAVENDDSEDPTQQPLVDGCTENHRTGVLQ